MVIWLSVVMRGLRFGFVLIVGVLVNAIKYGTKDAPIHVLLNGGSQQLQFEVRNSGNAIAPSDLKRLFEPLRRGSGGANASKSDTGLGLGLYICREIAKAHGGDIHASSRNGETAFAVSLPRQ